MMLSDHAKALAILGLPVNKKAAINLIARDAATKPILVLGADHPHIQHYGTANNGLSRMYGDLGLPHYLAINTDYVGSPGLANQMTWDQVKAIRDSNGCEIVSHSARHPNNWDRTNTGFSLLYTGAGSAANVTVTGALPTTPITIACAPTGAAGDAFSADTSNASYDTLAELKSYIEGINGGGKWVMTLAAELPDTAKSRNLLAYLGNRDCKTVKRFACGGGLSIRYIGSTPAVEATDAKTATYAISGGQLSLYADGVLAAPAYTLTNASYDTLAELAAAIELALPAWACAICDEGNSATKFGASPSIAITDTYITGTELSTNLVPFSGHRSCHEEASNITAGISNWQMHEYQLTRAVAVAAANDVTLRDFAQPGGTFKQRHCLGHGQHTVFRGSLDERATIAPLAIPSARVKDYHLQFPIDLTYTLAQMDAQIRALAASPGWTSCWLMHNLSPSVTPTAYSVGLSQGSSYTAGATEEDWQQVLNRVQSEKAAGNLNVVSMADAAAMAALQPMPKNLIFNPSFINSGESLSALTGDGGRRVPGWLVTTSTAGISSPIIVDGKFSVSLSAGSTTGILRQQVYLEPGKTYEIGMQVDMDYTSGNGVFVQLQKTRGSWKGNRVTRNLMSKVNITRSEHVKMRFTVPNRTTPKPYVRSVPYGTFDLSTNKNINLNILGIGAIDDLDCAAGAASTAAVTCYEIAANINAAIKAAAAYRDFAEYHNIAKGENGHVVLELPTTDYNNALTITVNAATNLSATTTIFGSTCRGAVLAHQMPSVEDYVMYLNFGCDMIGNVTFSNPYFSEVRYE